MIDWFHGARARSEDNGYLNDSRFAGGGEANAEVIRAMLEGAQPDAVVYPLPITQGYPSILTSLASDAPTSSIGGSPAAYFPGGTVGAGANVRFTAVFASGQDAGGESHLILSNGGIANLATTSVTNGITTATYVYAVSANDTAAAQLSVTGIERDGATYNGNVAAFLTIDPTIESPSDLLYSGEWYIHGTYGTHADKVWSDYTGKGVTVAVFDNGIEYGHPDLGNVDVSMGYNPDYDTHNGNGVTKNGDSSQELDSSGNDHGTAVAGLIGAGRNGFGSVGVAYDATLYSIFNYYGYSRPNDAPYDGQTNAFLDAARHADIMNNSWGYSTPFSSGANFATVGKSAGDALATAATEGRGGLGTIIVQSAGNDGNSRNDANASNYTNNPYSIVVGAASGLGRKYSFSTIGASVLVAAPGGGEITTDRAGAHGYNTDPNGGLYTDTSTSWFSGTSGAAPVTSGVVALLLEANPHLGARDVQEILAYSAAPNDAGDYDYYPTFFNGAGNWNNGGLRASNAVGFGLLDAHAAVRLAETWTTQKTWNNVVDQSAAIAPTGPDASTTLTGNGQVVMSQTIHLDAAQTIDHVELKLDIATTHPEFLSVVLTSPDGTDSILLNVVGSAGSGYYYYALDQAAGLHWTFGSTQFMGEMAAGDWTVTVYTSSDTATEYVPNSAGTAWMARPVTYPLTTTLINAELTVHGDAVDPNTTYIYTDAYAKAYHGALLTDADGGYDTINAAAVSGQVVVRLDGIAGSSLAGAQLQIGDDHVWRVFGGDAADTLVGGGTVPTVLSGMRGDDTLVAGAATTMLIGGAGDDVLRGGSGLSIADFSGSVASLSMVGGTWVVASAGEGADSCVDVDWAAFADGAFALNADGTTTRLLGTTCDVSIDPALGLGLSEDAAGFLAYSGALAAYADDISSLVITDAAALTLDVATLLGAAPLLDLVHGVAFTLSDTAAAIDAAIGDLSGLAGDLTAVTLTDTVRATILLTAAEYAGAQTLLAELSGDYNVSVAEDDGGRTVYVHRIDGAPLAVRAFDATGHLVSVTITAADSAAYATLAKTYAADGSVAGVEFTGVENRAYTHLVQTYEDGHLALERRDGYVSGDFTLQLRDYDAAGTLRSLVTSGFTDRPFTTLSLNYDAAGHLDSRVRDGFTGQPYTALTQFFDDDGTQYALRTAYTDGTSQLVGSKAGDTLSLALADTVMGHGGADRFVVSADADNGAIADFHRSQGDKIDLSHVFGSSADLNFVGTDAFDGTANSLRFDQVSGGSFVSIDLDGDKAADLTFEVHVDKLIVTDFTF